ncbi:MAG TPA: trehalose-phosphatase [Steroidobacteraceae bacterium]|jgi:trehalose 6-phosphate phosphatase
MSIPALPDLHPAHPGLADHNLALFLDVDGTLLEIAASPDAVVVPESLKKLLNELSIRLDGALALVSGRSLQVLDRLFTPFQFIAAGIHGCERREPSGCIRLPTVDLNVVAAAREDLLQWTGQTPGLLFEDKAYSLAVHYRRVPFMEAPVRNHLTALTQRMGREFELQPGKFVFEIRPAGFSKRSAIEGYMRQAPFRDRVPVFLGDDLTDESGFAIVNEMRGVSIRVGDERPTLATYHLSSVADAIQWLRALPLPQRNT